MGSTGSNFLLLLDCDAPACPLNAVNFSLLNVGIRAFVISKEIRAFGTAAALLLLLGLRPLFAETVAGSEKVQLYLILFSDATRPVAPYTIAGPYVAGGRGTRDTTTIISWCLLDEYSLLTIAGMSEKYTYCFNTWLDHSQFFPEGNSKGPKIARALSTLE
jgi:hypothetical protein